MTSFILGVDTGGTFTDFVFFDGKTIQIHKCLSTPENPEQAILQGIHELKLDSLLNQGKLMVVHGTTVATNAALQGKGVKTVYISNKGFKDTLSIGRQAREELYSLTPKYTQPPVPQELCLEVDTRRTATGELLQALTIPEIKALKETVERIQPQAIAINLLYSYLNDNEEVELKKALSDIAFTSISSFVLPEYKEYERGVATWLNAWLGPIVRNYLIQLEKNLHDCQLSIMQSSGGTIDATQAGNRAVNLLLSGPAGGLAATQYLSSLTGIKQYLTFDMGGTSTDVSLFDNIISLTSESSIAGVPVAVPMVNMHTIGAGGGSIAYLDAGGVLHVGPESAGSYPGPACYGHGGTQATVTDANAVLGYYGSNALLGGTLSLDIEASRKAIEPIATLLGQGIEETATGILNIANDHMTSALRVISIEKGVDPKAFTLCCFGGAGGLHICDIADTLGISNCMIPIHSGVFSAVGMLVAPRKRELSRTLNLLTNDANIDEILSYISLLSKGGITELRQEHVEEKDIAQQTSFDMRYKGQSFTLNIPFLVNDKNLLQTSSELFQTRHLQQYGHNMQLPIEIVNIRLSLSAPCLPFSLNEIISTESSTSSKESFCSIYNIGKTQQLRRETLNNHRDYLGPLLISEEVSTTLITKSWKVNVDKYGNLHLSKL